MRKFSVVIFTLGLMVVLAGCQTVGDKIGAKHEGEEPATVGTDGLDQPATDQEQVVKPTAAKNNNIFFGSKKYDPEVKNCAAVYWVHIDGDVNMDPIERNLKLLLAGPTEKWSSLGYYTAIPEGTKLNSVRVDGDTIYADFSPELNDGAGSCSVIMAFKQIEYTAKYAAQEYFGLEINKVIISVGGQTADVLQP